MTYQTVEEIIAERDDLRAELARLMEWTQSGAGLCSRLSGDEHEKPLYASPVPAPSLPESQAALDVLAERRRQIEAEGWTPEYDDKHSAGEMAKAAACYALVSAGFNPDAMINVWPWHRLWWRPRDKRRNLVKAAALILAEIERLDRVAAPRMITPLHTAPPIARKCATCKHWHGEQNADETRTCAAVPMLWDATEWSEDGRRVTSPKFANTLAFVTDGSDYFAALLTKPDFGCVMHEPAPQTEAKP